MKIFLEKTITVVVTDKDLEAMLNQNKDKFENTSRRINENLGYLTVDKVYFGFDNDDKKIRLMVDVKI